MSRTPPPIMRKFMLGDYARRNDEIVRRAVPLAPQVVVELAGGAIDVVTKLLKRARYVRSYTYVERNTDLVRHCAYMFRRDKRVRAVYGDGESWRPPACDLFISLALEHIAADREIVTSLASGTRVILNCPKFLTSTHHRAYATAADVSARYGDLLSAHDVTDMAPLKGGRRFLLVGVRA